jgi:hypothetical protein
VEGEDDVLAGGEDRVVVGVAEPVRVLGGGLELHQVDDVDDADLQLGEMLAEDRDGGQDLQGGGVTAAGHHDIRLFALVVAGPGRRRAHARATPDVTNLAAVPDRPGIRHPGLRLPAR